MSELHYDLCVIGGGINGAGIARDAAGRGLSVLLIEAEDLASATSSSSSKFIHGGLRYLEYLEFKMVREALQEREVLYRSASHLIEPLEFVFLQDNDLRPSWLTRIGLLVYDHLGGGKSLPNSKMVKLANGIYGRPLIDSIRRAVVYYDCYADDSRLVVTNALDAASRGAKVLTYTKCEGLKEKNGQWQVSLRDTRTDDRLDVTASMVVNATGPWAGKFLNYVGIGEDDPELPSVRLVKGSHLILPKLYEGEHAYVLQQKDKRIVFVAPYQGKYTLVGTTEEDYDGDPRDADISEEETAYLCYAVNRAFRRTIIQTDIEFTYSGVRPLIDDGEENSSAVSRDFRIYHHEEYQAPLITVYGGKLTTYRAVSEAAVDKLMEVSNMEVEAWTASKPLIGGEFGRDDVEGYFEQKKLDHDALPEDLLRRYVYSYGTRTDVLLNGAKSVDDLGAHLGDQVYEAEIDYLVRYEWAQSVDDIVWRRSKLGLYVSDDTIKNIEAVLAS